MKLYSEMSVDEQLRYVTDLTSFCEDKLPVLERIGDAWEASMAKDMETGLLLMSAFQYARDFVEKAFRYGDYAARVRRIKVYIDRIKNDVAEGVTIQGSDGKTYACVPPNVPMRRRGRPSKEELQLRAKGVTVPNDDTPETLKRRKIAQLLGLEIMVQGEAPREKNNAELKAERDARRAEEARRNPSLFAAENGDEMHGNGDEMHGQMQRTEQKGTEGATGQGYGDKMGTAHVSSTNGKQSPCAQLMSDSYEMRMAQDKLHLNQLAWLLSKPLQENVMMVQALRVTAESSSERAKTMSDMGAKAEEIEPYARQAKEATESYLAIYKAVDEELAVLHRRITLDKPFVEKFKERFKGVDMERVLYITRPYYEKMKSPELEVRVQTIIRTDNPEYAAQMQAEEEKKQEVSDLLRYLKRKDKPNVKQRIETMEKRYLRLIELLGEDEARTYRPIVDAAREDYEKNHRPTTDRPTPSPSLNGGECADKKPAKKAPALPSGSPEGKKPKKADKSAPKKTTTKKPKK